MTVAQKPITDLFGLLLTQVRRLVRTECEIARSEIGENLGRMRSGLTLLAIAASLLLPAITVILAGIAIALSRIGVPAAFAALIVGGSVLLIGVILAVAGLNRFKTVKILPARALNQMQRDIAAVNPMRQSHEHPTA